MNILYISNLSGTLWNGPNNSIPAQIRAQSKIDNVFWFNYSFAKRKEWTENGLDCKNLQDIPNVKLELLPSPFKNPDIVIIEEFYVFPFNRLIREIQKKHIPYVIVPRSQMTMLALKHKQIKKIIGNILFFSKIGQNASAIHYLTEREKSESVIHWKPDGFVIPNGINIPKEQKNTFKKNGIAACYIGRVEIYQKGLDVLLESISELQNLLREKNFKLSIYGPCKANDVKILNKIVKKNKICDIVKFEKEVFAEEKKKVLLETDVFIMTSKFEGLPMGLIEALSYGVPCLATKGTNMSDEIFGADAGWVAENEMNSVKEALLQMCSTEDFSKKGNNARNLAQKYSWDAIAEQTHNMYERIINLKV